MPAMYGLIGRIRAVPGRRDELTTLLTGMGSMPGCLLYLVANDRDDPDSLVVTEVWDDESSHRASLALPAVQEAIGRGRALIAGMEQVASTEPIGGIGFTALGTDETI